LTVNNIVFGSPGAFAGQITIANITDTFAGAPGQCAPTNRRNVVANFNGTQTDRLGSGTAVVLGLTFDIQNSVGSLNTVMGTFTDHIGDSGQFTCTY
jgi:hypothetical protein